nr:hypothetical protein [Hypoxylon rubiginosum]
MPPRYDEAPELAPHNFPEVHHPPSVPEVSYGSRTPVTPAKPEDLTNPSLIHPIPPTYAAIENNSPSPYQYDHHSGASGGSPTTVTVSAPSATPTGFSDVDKGCSTNSAGVTGSTYTSQFFNRPTYRIYCNSDAPNTPLSSLFVGNFDDCIDACASYSFYIPLDFSSNRTSGNATCAGVSYIPAWTNRTFAFDGDAPGNCYLKPGPQNQTALNNPNIGGSAVHAAILDTS